MKNRFFALMLIGWHTCGLGMVEGMVDFALPTNQFYSINNKQSPFAQFTELAGSALTTKDPQQARISFNMLRSLRAIRSFFEGVSKGWSNPIDTARNAPAYMDTQLDTISNELAKTASMDPKEVAPLSLLRQAIYDKILPNIKDGMQMGYYFPLTDLMLLEAYFDSDTEAEKIAVLKKSLPEDVFGIDVDQIIKEAHEAQKLDLAALYRGFVDGAFIIKVEDQQYPEFLGSTRLKKVISMLGSGLITGHEVDIANQYGLPLIYADEGIAAIKSVITPKGVKHTISTELSENVALFGRFKNDKNPKNSASGSLLEFSKEIETRIKNDIGDLLAQPKKVPEKAKADHAFINTYLDGLLVYMVNKYVINDPAVNAQIIDRWNKKGAATTQSLKATGLYSALLSESLTTQLTDFGIALMALSNQ